MKFTKILRRQKTLRITLRKTPSSGRTLKVPFLVKNALGKFLGYVFENLGYFFTKLSGHPGTHMRGGKPCGNYLRRVCKSL